MPIYLCSVSEHVLVPLHVLVFKPVPGSVSLEMLFKIVHRQDKSSHTSAAFLPIKIYWDCKGCSRPSRGNLSHEMSFSRDLCLILLTDGNSSIFCSLQFVQCLSKQVLSHAPLLISSTLLNINNRFCWYQPSRRSAAFLPVQFIFLRLQRARSLIARGNVCGKVLLRREHTSCRYHVNASR